MPLSTSTLAAYDVGADTGDFITNMAREARDVVCDIYSVYPDWAANTFPGNPAVGFRRGLFDSLCRKIPPRAPQSNSNFTGGQCSAVYNVTIPYTYTFSGFGGEQFTQSGVLDLGGFNGPIVSATASLKPSGANVFLEATVVGTGPGNTNTLSGPAGIRYDYVGPFRIIRTDGNPDNCGDRDTPLPTTSPTAPDLIKYRPIPDGRGGTRNFPVIIPIPVLLKPTIDVQVGPVTFEIGPVDVNILPNANFNINFPVSFPNPGLPPGFPAPPLAPGRPTAPNYTYTSGCDLEPVLNALASLADDVEDVDKNIDSLKPTLEDIKECACGPDTTIVEEIVGSGGSGVVTLPDRTERVKIVVNPGPTNTKYQSGGSNAPDVIFAGWYSVGVGTFRGDRKPISFNNNIFEVPEGCNSLQFTVVKGASAVVTALYRVDVLP